MLTRFVSSRKKSTIVDLLTNMAFSLQNRIPTVREIAASRHPNQTECLTSQTETAWFWINLFFHLSQIPGSNLPNIEDFSSQNVATKNWINTLHSKFPIVDNLPSQLLAYVGELVDLPNDVAIAIPMSLEGDGQPSPNAHYGQVELYKIDTISIFKMYCVMEPKDHSSPPPLDLRLRWFESCLDEILKYKHITQYKAVALSYKFNESFDNDESAWHRYKQVMEAWATRHCNDTKLVVVGFPD